MPARKKVKKRPTKVRKAVRSMVPLVQEITRRVVVPMAIARYRDQLHFHYPELGVRMDAFATHLSQQHSLESILDPLVSDRQEQDRVAMVSETSIQLGLTRLLAMQPTQDGVYEALLGVAFDHLIFGIWLGEQKLAHIVEAQHGFPPHSS